MDDLRHIVGASIHECVDAIRSVRWGAAADTQFQSGRGELSFTLQLIPLGLNEIIKSIDSEEYQDQRDAAQRANVGLVNSVGQDIAADFYHVWDELVVNSVVFDLSVPQRIFRREAPSLWEHVRLDLIQYVKESAWSKFVPQSDYYRRVFEFMRNGFVPGRVLQSGRAVEVFELRTR